MAGLCSIVCAILSLALYPVDVQAEPQIFFPSGNVTYLSPGSFVQLPWTYNYTKPEISVLRWVFTKSGSGTEIRLAAFFIEAGNTKPRIDDPTMFNITGQATLEFKNANLTHNGTYTFRVIPTKNGKIKESKILVIILEQPTAVIKCSTASLIVKEGKDITCLCSATGGNPPATASWSRNGMVINGTGYLKKNLIIKNISEEETGTYNCTVRSHNLTDAKYVNITLKPKYKPRSISLSVYNKSDNMVTSGEKVIIICKADAYPDASYSISFNGSQLLSDAVNGVYNISSVNDSHIGIYTCVAKNSIGNVSAQLDLIINARPTPTQIMPTRTSNQSASMSTAPPDTRTTGAPTSKKDKSIAPIVGGAIGGLVFLIICIVLIWYCCCKRSASGSCKRGNGGGEDIVVNPANPSYAAMGDSMDRGNAYESVDQAKVDQARDDESGPSNENPPDAGNSLPPVYAVVNKSKKTPKPPPEKQPDSLTYASLDPVVLQPNSSKMRDRTREETNYASIDLEKLKKDQE